MQDSTGLLFDELDTNHDGTIDRAEWEAAMAPSPNASHISDDVLELLDVADLHIAGFTSAAELLNALSQGSNSPAASRGSVTTSSVKASSQQQAAGEPSSAFLLFSYPDVDHSMPAYTESHLLLIVRSLAYY